MLYTRLGSFLARFPGLRGVRDGGSSALTVGNVLLLGQVELFSADKPLASPSSPSLTLSSSFRHVRSGITGLWPVVPSR